MIDRIAARPDAPVDPFSPTAFLAPVDSRKDLGVAQHPYLNRDSYEPDVGSAADENSLKKIFRLLRTQTRVDFRQYKRNTKWIRATAFNRKQMRSAPIEPRAIEPGTTPPEHSETASATVSTAPDLHRAQRETDRLVISRYALATALIDENLNTIYFQGHWTLS